MTTTTAPCPADQAATVQRPASLAELALSADITPEHVGAYVRDCAGYLNSTYRFVRSDCGLMEVGQ